MTRKVQNFSSQETGFFSNRTRNAARLMEMYKDVDLFTPSIVDLNEGDPGVYSSIAEQALLYSSIAVASNGRILPIISYHPGRSYTRESNPQTRLLNFRLLLLMVEFAIEQLGFVGVKVHPSSGFAPIDNKQFGCPNEAVQDNDALPDAEAEHFNDAMDALFGLCRRLDVPILTRCSLGILA